MIRDLVSTVIPVYNRPALLREAVASVLVQDYRPIEVIIVDDGSTDDSARVAAELAACNPGVIRLFRIANSGPGFAREIGRKAACGEFIQYLDSDDLLMPGKFSAQVASLRVHPECGVAYGKTGYGVDTTHPCKWTGERIETMWPSFLQWRWWDTSTPLYRREVTDAVGPWENLCQEEDWVYDCRAAILGTRLCYVDQFVSVSGNRVPDRLGGNTSLPRYWRDRATAHCMIWECVTRIGLNYDQPEFHHFARELFLLARQCGAAGLAAESRELFQLARAASGPQRERGLDFRLYRALASLLGWTRVGWLACAIDRW
jgi:glycosyltransferase involved in cell wall biosynthesis